MSSENEQLNEINLKLMESILKESMLAEGYTEEMISLLCADMDQCSERFYILDDSGSMSSPDGETYNKISKRMTNCTRFEEMKNSVGETFKLFAHAGVNSYFLTLNKGPVEINNSDSKSGNDRMKEFEKTLYSATGGTPLNAALNTVKEKMIKDGKKKILVIYSDGVSSDGNILDNILCLQRNNVHIVVRLCTDEQPTVDFWNKIDAHQEINLDIIDSYDDERKEVLKMNPMLNYTYEFHRLREIGFTLSGFDKLDEHKLSDSELERLNNIFKVEEVGCSCTIC